MKNNSKQGDEERLDTSAAQFFENLQATSADVSFGRSYPSRQLGRKLRAAIQTRRSVISEGGKSKSIKQQLAEAFQVCQMYDFSVDPKHIYDEEEGTKGDHSWPGSGLPQADRHVLGSMMEAMERQEFDVVVTWRTDRLYRDSGVADALLKRMVKNNVALYASRRDYAINTSSGYANAMNEAVRNRELRDKISEDIRRDLDFKARCGQLTRNAACLGFRSAGKGTQAVRPVPHELDLARRIFNLYVIGENGEGPLGWTAIANKLLSEDILLPCLYDRGEVEFRKYIDADDIRRILRCVSYIAKWRHGDGIFDCPVFLLPAADGSGKMETAVPRALWQAAQEKLETETKADKKNPGRGTPHMLTGLVICGCCGRTQYVLSRKDNREGPDPVTRRNFRCQFRFRPKDPCRKYPMKCPNEDAVESWIVSELAPLLGAQMEELRSAAGVEGDRQLLASLNRQLDEARKRESKSLARNIDILDDTQFADLATTLRAEREHLVRQVDVVEQRLEVDDHLRLDFSAAAVAQMPRSALRAALQHLVRWIAVTQTGLIVLTRWGTYIAATYRKGKWALGEHHNQVLLDAASPVDALTCLSWMPDPDLFVWGRRETLGAKARDLSDAELLPGIGDVGDRAGQAAAEAYMPEFESPWTDDAQVDKAECGLVMVAEAKPTPEPNRRWKKSGGTRRVLAA